MTSYLSVLSIKNDGMVNVRNQHGNVMQMSKELLDTMYSGRHYSSTVNLSMTALAELLQSVQDNIFTVNFKK